MQDSKDNIWGQDYSVSTDGDAKTSDESSDTPVGQPVEADGWQQYRRWISKTPAPRSRRTGVDPSLYTWKGYRNWTEQVKRNWSDS